MNIRNSRKVVPFGLLSLLLLGFILYSNVVALRYNCLNAFDFGLYYQAISKMSLQDLNPYLTIRTLNIFNDHFEPALMLASLFTKLSFLRQEGLILFEWLSFILAITTLIFLKGKRFIFQIIFLCLFCRGILTALNFPVHPNTWSMPVWSLVIYFLLKGRTIALTLSVLTLLLFRESYVFALPGLCAYGLYRRDRALITTSFLATCLGFLFIFYLRPLLLGPSYDYGGVFIQNLKNEHIFYLGKVMLELKWAPFLKVLLPFSLPIYLGMRGENRDKLIGLILILGPILFLHILAGKIHYHYGITFSFPLLAFFILSNDLDKALANRKIWITTALLFFATSTSTYTRWFKQSILGRSKKCSLADSKRSDIVELNSWLDKNHDFEKTVIATRKSVPSIVSKQLKVYVHSEFTTHLKSYDFLIFEGEGSSFFRLRQKCSLNIDARVFFNESFEIYQGPILAKCYLNLTSI